MKSIGEDISTMRQTFALKENRSRTSLVPTNYGEATTGAQAGERTQTSKAQVEDWEYTLFN